MKRAGLAAIVTAAAACGPAPNLLPVNDLNRPTDVAFMCFGAFPGAGGADAGAPMQISGRPMRACHPPDNYDPGATTTTRTFAFMPNSAAGTLSAVDADHWKLVDLNLDTGGYGTAPLGQLPIQISASDDGCRLISANRGSCDLTLVDPSVLVAPTFSSQENVDLTTYQSGHGPSTASLTFRPIKGDGTQLLAAPYEAVFLPQDTTSLVPAPTPGEPLPILPAPGPLCSDSPAVDPLVLPEPASTPRSWYVLVTYPSCNLIAVVALPSGRIVSSAMVQQAGQSVTLVDTKTSPVCPIVDCAGQALPAADDVTTDAAAGGDGAGTTGTIAAPPGEAGVSDAALLTTDAGGGASGSGGGGGGASGVAGVTGSAGAGAGGSSPGATGGATGGVPLVLGNQIPPGPYFGTGPLAPSGIAIVPDGTRAYISLANASFVLSVGLSSSGLALLGKPILLDEGARGSSRIRLSVDPTRFVGGSIGTAGVFVGADPSLAGEPGTNDAHSKNFLGVDPDRKYLYAIARDGTLRVIQVKIAGAETECETNADPLFLAAGDSASSPCIKVDPAHRRPFSVGPGIHFPSLPIDVAAVDLQRPADYSEQSVNGAHAWVLTDSGIVYLVNISPVLRSYTAVINTSADPKNPDYVSVAPPSPGAPIEPPPFVNTLRDRNEISYSLTSDPSSGPPRVDVLPSLPATGPYLEPFWTQGSILNATALSGLFVQTVAFFPQVPPNPLNVYDPIDRRAVTAQTWTVSWEGPLTGIRNSGNAYTLGALAANPSLFPTGGGVDRQVTDALLEDGGANYCALGVVPGDLVTLTGCTDTSQCGLGEGCLLGQDVSSAAAGLSVTGICVDPNRQSEQTSACAPYLNSLRRYSVAGASQNGLIIRPHLDEVVLASISPLCHPDIPATATTNEIPDSCPDTIDDPTTANFKCVSSYPGAVTTPRCLMQCKQNGDCRSGRLCVNFDTTAVTPQFCDPTAKDPGPNCPCTGMNCFCADAPPFDEVGKSCFDQLVSYQVNAGRSFLVAGSQAGFVTTATLPPNGGVCSGNPTPDARFSFRIPMGAPACANVDPSVATIDSRLDPDAFPTGSTMMGVAARASTLVNVVTSMPPATAPCLYMGGPVIADPVSANPLAVATNPDGTPTYTHVRALFQNSQISFVLADLDRGPTSEFTTSFDVHGGFSPQVVQDPTTLEVSMPARIVVGPVDSLAQLTTGTPVPPAYEAPYLFVVDQRRLGREQGGGPTRGQLLRINPFGYTSTVGSVTGYQPIFEDYNASGGLFPIQ